MQVYTKSEMVICVLSILWFITHAGGVECRLLRSRESSLSEMSPAPALATGDALRGIFTKFWFSGICL